MKTFVASGVLRPPNSMNPSATEPRSIYMIYIRIKYVRRVFKIPGSGIILARDLIITP